LPPYSQTDLTPSERERLISRYEGWKKIRDAAVKNSNGTAPPIVLDNSYPPLPPPIDDADIADLSMELNNVHLEENMHGVDDIVPEADPEVDTNVSCWSTSTFVLANPVSSIDSLTSIQSRRQTDR
jgi:serine/threonine-protein phosphatase 2A regulatory subunit B'